MRTFYTFRVEKKRTVQVKWGENLCWGGIGVCGCGWRGRGEREKRAAIKLWVGDFYAKYKLPKLNCQGNIPYFFFTLSLFLSLFRPFIIYIEDILMIIMLRGCVSIDFKHLKFNANGQRSWWGHDIIIPSSEIVISFNSFQLSPYVHEAFDWFMEILRMPIQFSARRDIHRPNKVKLPWITINRIIVCVCVKNKFHNYYSFWLHKIVETFFSIFKPRNHRNVILY